MKIASSGKKVSGSGQEVTSSGIKMTSYGKKFTLNYYFRKRKLLALERKLL